MNDIVKIHMGEALRAIVDESKATSGGTLSDIAARAAMSPQAMSNVFSRHSVSVDVVARICRACFLKTYQFVAFMETGIPTKAWSNFERIMNLEETDKNFVLEGINNSLRFIIEKNKKAVD